MNKYLVKIAKANEDPDKLPTYKKVGLGALTAFASEQIGDFAQAAAGDPIRKEFTNKSHVGWKTLKKVMRSNPDLNVTFSPHKAVGDQKRGDALKAAFSSKGPSAFDHHGHEAAKKNVKNFAKKLERISPDDAKTIRESFSGKLKKNYVHMGTQGATSGRSPNLNVALHEMGHIKDMTKPGLASKLKVKAYNAGRSNFAAGSVAGGAMLTNEKTRNYAWLAPLVHQSGVIRGEAAANYHGHKMLSQHGTPAMKKQFRGVAGKNMLGYLAKPLAQSAYLGIAALALNNSKKKVNEGK